MPGDSRRKPLTGTPLAKVFSSTLLSKMIDVAHGDKLDRRGNVAQHFKQSGIVKVRNDTGADLDRFNIVGLGDPLVLAADSIDEFQRRPTFSGEDPTAAHAGKFGVLLEPLKDGSIGDAVVSGVVQVQVEMETEGHAYAEVSTDPEALISTGSGSAQILWAESGTGTKWAIVKLGSNAGSDTNFFKVTGAITSGVYPGLRYVATSTAFAFEVSDPTETAWILPSNGELLTKRIYYPCKLFGVHTDGLCIYVPTMIQQTIGGKLDGTLSYHSSAAMSVWGNSGGSAAAGTSVRTADAVTSVTITNGGSSYEWAPEVVFSGGGGTGAAGTAVLTADVVTSVTITSGGSGYTSNPTVTFNAESDTGENVTVHDQTILSSGGSVAAGKFIVAYYCLMSRRWKLATAQCP